MYNATLHLLACVRTHHLPIAHLLLHLLLWRKLVSC
jgi:hypothetical protein